MTQATLMSAVKPLRLAVLCALAALYWLTSNAYAQQSVPAITEPAPSAQLSGSSVLFRWAANGAAVQQWYFRAGLAPSSTEFANTRFRSASTLQYRVDGLPTNGEPIFVEFSYLQPDGWKKTILQFQAFDNTGTGNLPPNAMNDSAGPVNAGQNLIIPVLSNDDDSDGTINPASIVIVSLPVSGTAVALATGQISYTHNGAPGTGSDSLSYTVQDDDGDTSNIATVTISPIVDPDTDPQNQPPLAANDTAGPLDAGQNLTINVLGNDSDADGSINPATVTIVSGPASGTASVLANGQISYTHNGAAGTGSDSLSYTVQDDDGDTSNIATVTISPIVDPDTGPQQPTITSPLPGTQLPGTDVTFTWTPGSVAVRQWFFRAGRSPGTAEFANIRFRNAAAREYRVTALPADGSPVFIEFSYLASSSWIRQTFQYQAFGGNSTVNQAPVAVNDAAGPLDAGQNLTINVLGNDSDADGSINPATVTIVSGPAAGNATVLSDGRISYTHNGAAGTGSDSLSYTVQDDDGDSSNIATVTISPIVDPDTDPQNQPPLAANDTAGPLDAGQSLTINVLGNDSDADGSINPATVTIVSGPAAGNATVLSDGRISYTHNGAAGTGSDSLSYTVQDDDGDTSNIASVTISPIVDPDTDPQNQPPLAANDTAGPLDAGQNLSINVLGNDSDADGTINPATVTIVSGPASGNATVLSDGRISYTHNGAAGTGSDSLSYTVQDDDGDTSNVATVTISPIVDPDTDPQNQPPLAANDTAGPLDAGQSLTINVLGNDSDADGTINPATVAIVSGPASGNATVLSDGQISYTHNGAAGTGSDSLSYTVQDDDGDTSNIATVTISPIVDPDTGPQQPTITSPLPGTQLPGTDVTFTWTPGSVAVRQWFFRAGRSSGTAEFANIRFRNAAAREYRVTGLPADGSPVFIEFSYLASRSWIRQTFQYQAFDGNSTVNQAPVAVNDVAGPLDAGQNLTISVLGNDSDADGTINPATVTIVSGPASGNATVLANGQISYAHDGAINTGSDSFTYTVQDDDGATSNTATVTIEPINDPLPENEAPVAADDTAGPVVIGQSLTFDVLDNDTDADGTLVPGTITIVSQPIAGTAQVETNGQITYTHNGTADTTQDSLTYTVQDDDGAVSNVATVTITPFIQPEPENEAPVAADDTAGPIIIGQNLTFDVLDNDTDADGTLVPGTITIVSQPTAGTAQVETDGQITYTHDGTADTTQDSLTYTVQDDDGAVSNEATVTITPFIQPEPENEAPVAADDTAGPVIIGQNLTFDVLDNDTDADGTLVPGTITIVSQPIAGTAQVETNGQITYTHNGTADTTQDSLTYTVQDDDGAVSNVATVTITPFIQPEPENEAPVAADDTAGPVVIGQSLTFDVLGNDTDVDGTLVPGTVTIVSQPSAGTAQVETDGQITYTHDGNADTTQDSLTYTVQDDDGAVSNEATVTITPFVQPEPENEAPVAADDTAGPVVIGQSLTFDVLDNDTDADGTLVPGTITIVSQPTAGTAQVETDGQITYTHDGTADTTEDSLTYTVQDDDGAVSNEATVTITPFVQPEPENEAPVAADDTAGPVVIGQSLTFDVLDNDTDADGTLVPGTITIVSQPTAGTAQVETDGQITYTHDGTADTTQDSLTYTVQDDDGAVSNEATVTITPFIQPEPENEAPVAADDTAGPVTIGQSLTFDVLDNDTDADGALASDTVTIVSQPTAGNALVETDGQITYTHDGTADTTQDSLTYTVQDDDGAVSNEATVTITPFIQPEPENEAPVAADDTAGPVIIGQSLTFDVLGNDTDADGTIVPETVTIVSQPAAGTAQVETDGQITYTHDGTLGTLQDVLTYTVQDDDSAISNEATVTITPFVESEPENDAPIAADDTAGPVVIGQSLTFDVLSNDTDADGTLVTDTVTIVLQPTAGNAQIEADGQITYTHDGTADTTQDSLTYTVQDDDGAVSNEATVTITPFVEPDPENEAPVAANDTAGPVTIGQSLTFDVLGNDTDADGTLVTDTVTIVSQPTAGTAQVETDGQITYTHDGTPGTLQDVLTYTVQDDDGAISNEATVTITPFVESEPENEAPVAADDTAGPVIIGQSLTFDVLGNDTDADGTLVPDTVTIVSQPAAGTAQVETNGQITYTHDGTADTVQDSLTYTVQDDDGAISNEATVTITPFEEPDIQNEAPIAVDDTIGPIVSGNSLTFTVMANDIDTDGDLDPETLTITTLPSWGSVMIEDDYQITYSHDGSLGTQSDSFTYTVRDDDGDLSNEASVTISPIVDPDSTNVTPVASDDIAGPVGVGETITFSVISNDTDIDGILLPETVTIIGAPVQGMATVTDNGQITYVHNGTTGISTDSLVYTVADNDGATSNEATATILIGEALQLTTPLLLPLDITFDNLSWEGNPFDLLAIATYTHTASTQTRSAELFYAGNDQWTARFVADRTGEWLFVTESEDAELNGHTGTITVSNSSEKGFVVAQQEKWTRSASGEAFVPQYAMAGTLSDFAATPGKIAADLDTFIGEHGFTGLHIRGYCQWFQLGNDRCAIPSEERDPDLATFEVVESIIQQTTARGGTTHIWMYGDNFRNQNPSNWGLNGTEDLRVQRYLAARLGALPGWTIGYGYDISEWATPAQVETWYNNLNERMLYPHLTSARGDKNIIMQHTEILSYSSYEQHNPDYSWYVTAIQQRANKPTFAEDRYRIDEVFQEKDYTYEKTRRGLWHSAMAGGVANIWGNLQFDAGGSYDEGSRAYPNKDELKLYSDFMTPRFRADLQLCNALSDGYCLRAPGHTQYIIYKEETESISIDLSAVPGGSQYTAINTITGETIDGVFNSGQQVWNAPYIADWVVEVLPQ